MKSKTQQACDEFLKNPALTINEISNNLNCSGRTVKRGVRKAKQILRSNANQVKTQETSDTTEGSNRSIVTTSSDIRTLDDLIAFSKIDTDEWDVVKHTVNSWGSATNENFQVKAWLKKRGDEFSIKEYIDEFKDSALTHSPTSYIPISHIDKSNNAVEISIHDLHFGSLCWGPETGEGYDIKIAQRIYLDAVNYLAAATESFKPSEIILPVGSDFFNVNSMLNMTAHGTPQDEDCRWQKTYIYGRRMVVMAVDKLRNIAPVKVFIVPGNHDEERAFYLGDSLECWYKNCNNVTVDNTPGPRKYWKWGKCLLGLTHGKDEVKGTLPLIMADEVPELWVDSKFKEWHTGHLHHKAKKSYDYATEVRGVREKILGSLAATDSWHTKKGYSGLREAEAFVWNKDKGNIASFAYHPV